MKKTAIIFLAGLMIAGTAFSQVTVGIQGTGNLGGAKITAAELTSPEKKLKAMPGAGIVADVQLKDHLAIRTGINFLQNGVKISTETQGLPGTEPVKVEATTALNYLQIPVNILYMTSGSEVKFYAGGGPYISYGIGGKLKTTTTEGSTVEKEEAPAFKNGNGESYFKRIDLGLGVLAGVKLPNGLFASVGYQYSFTNINTDEAGIYKSRGLQLSIGYFLWSSR